MADTDEPKVGTFTMTIHMLMITISANFLTSKGGDNITT